MKLIDLLVQELPKHGGWPDDCQVIAQDEDRQLAAYHPKTHEFIQYYQIYLSERCDKHRVRNTEAKDSAEMVTREQYEAALAAAQQSVWDGTGLPPVGVECEYRFPNVNYRSTFSRGKVLAYGAQKVFMEHWSSKNEFIQPLDNIEFRPIRTERDEAIEEMRKVVTNYNKTDVIHAIEQLYDAGYRKQ